MLQSTLVQKVDSFSNIGRQSTCEASYLNGQLCDHDGKMYLDKLDGEASTI